MLYTPPLPSLTVDVSDRLIGGLTYKQRVTFLSLEHVVSTSSVLLQVQVDMYTPTLEGSYGQCLTGVEGFTSRVKHLVANNDAAVSNSALETAGNVVLMRGFTTHKDPDTNKLTFTKNSQEEGLMDWYQRCEDHPESLILQGNFFLVLRDYFEIDINSLITNHILQADQMGKFQ